MSYAQLTFMDIDEGSDSRSDENEGDGNTSELQVGGKSWQTRVSSRLTQDARVFP